MCRKADTFFTYSVERHFSLLVKDRYLDWFEYTHFEILINLVTANH